MDHLPITDPQDPDLPGTLELGAFSVSLAVADLEASRQFYARLGFEEVGGDAEHGFLMLANGEAVIGLFHGMFEGNILTFNPGLTNRMQRRSSFTDVRAIAEHLADAGVELTTEIDPEAGPSGPAHVALVDPDGNAILIDQHLASD